MKPSSALSSLRIVFPLKATMRHRLTGPALALALLCTTAHAADVVVHTQDFATPALPFTISYGQTFTAASADTFHDDYLFAVQSASFSTATLTMSLGSLLAINELRAQLYRYTDALQPVTGAALMDPTQATLIAQASGANLSITALDLSAGRYVLDISGIVTGSAGGSYAGVFNLSPVLQAAPVPEPAGLWLAAVGLAGLAATRRRAR